MLKELKRIIAEEPLGTEYTEGFSTNVRLTYLHELGLSINTGQFSLRLNSGNCGRTV